MEPLSLLTPLAQGFAAYSLGALLVLAITALGERQFSQPLEVRLAGWGLLAALAGLQVAHAAWLWNQSLAMHTHLYGLALLLVAPCFYLMAHPVLVSTAHRPNRTKVVLHLAPSIAAFTLPMAWVMPVAFGLGSLYLAWLLRALWPLRALWRLEVWLLGVSATVGVAVCGAGLAQAGHASDAFYSAYAIAIGVLLLLAQLLLGLRPQLAQEVTEAVQATSYATTTLSGVDVSQALVRLHALMVVEHRYRDPELSLSVMAEALNLSVHQLSELINTRLGKGFARYLREHRVQAARAMLLDEPSASVLSVGLSVGFNSQSNFYEAFREIEGSTPGQFRKLHRGQRPANPPPDSTD